MNLRDLYFNQPTKMSLQALRAGYYLIVAVSKTDNASGKQEASASAYWNPFEANFDSCLAVRVNLKSLGNRISQGPKEVDYKQLVNKVVHLHSVELVPSLTEGFDPSYKIVWSINGEYPRLPYPTFFLNKIIEEKWCKCEAFSQEGQAELDYLLLLEQEDEQALNDYYLCESGNAEEDELLDEIYLAEQEEDELYDIPDQDDAGDGLLESDLK